jgi:phenylacetate-CoA ligase
MFRVIDRLTDLLKSTASVDRALRYNARYYDPVRQLLRELDATDREGRRELSERLTRRTLEWAGRLRGGLNPSVPIEDRPIIDKSQLRDDPERFTLPGMIRIPAATSGTTGIPLRLRRSLACIAAEQAFIDDLMGVWNLTFRDATMVRLRADAVKGVAQRTPPYGVYRDGGKKLVLSSNHLSPQTASWFHAELARFKPQVLFTHPSSGEALASFMQQQGLSLEIPLVLTSSEMLHPSGRMLMEAAFNSTVIDYYGMAERVVFAAGLAADSYYFNPAYGRVELVSVSDGEAPAGFKALEIVATGYWNDAMPLVRYRSGDRVVVPNTYTAADLEDVTLGLKPVRSIQGRDKEHLISPSGEVVVGLTHAAYGVRGLVRMQVVQFERESIVVRIVADPRHGKVDEAQLLTNLRQFVPGEMSIQIETVSEIERLPNGKTPFVIRRLDTER